MFEEEETLFTIILSVVLLILLQIISNHQDYYGESIMCVLIESIINGVLNIFCLCFLDVMFLIPLGENRWNEK